MLDVDRRIEIGVRAVATDHTAKRLLVWVGWLDLDNDRRCTPAR